MTLPRTLILEQYQIPYYFNVSYVCKRYVSIQIYYFTQYKDIFAPATRVATRAQAAIFILLTNRILITF